MIHPTVRRLGIGKLVPKVYLLTPGLSLVFCCTSIGSPVYAAGFDVPEPPLGASQATTTVQCTSLLIDGQPMEVVLPDGQRKCKRKTQMLDWQQWSKPYAQGQVVCRDRTGNVVCLTPSVAEKLRW